MDTTQLTIDDIVRFATALPVEQRRELVRQVKLTLPYEGLSEDDPNFLQELRRRSAAMRSGEDPGFDHDTVMRLLRARIDRTRQG